MIFNNKLFFNGFIERLQDDIPSFLMDMEFSPLKVGRNDIFSPQGKMMTLYISQSFFPLGVEIYIVPKSIIFPLGSGIIYCTLVNNFST
jgi:hypothetical protein